MADGWGRLVALGAVLAVLSALWLAWGLPDARWEFVLHLRAVKLAALLTVGAAVAVATVLFQTVTMNRILTPSIMGFDALYILMQTLLVAELGLNGFADLPKGAKFLAETGVMVVAALALFGTLLGRGPRDVARMVLTGVILGVLFRSLSGFVARVLDPNAYSVVQSVSFANFSRVDAALLGWGAGVCGLAVRVAFLLAPRLDVMALGRRTAVSLGLPYARLMLGVLALVAVLVAVSTALVGPVAFFGLIVAGLAQSVVASHRHALTLPAAVLIAGILLVGGQLLFERGLGQQGTLSVVVEFLGGVFFLWLLLKGRIR